MRNAVVRRVKNGENMEPIPPQQNLETPAVFRSNRGRNLQLVGERTGQAMPPQSSTSEAARVAQIQAKAAAKEAEFAAALSTVKVAFAILGSRALVILAALGAFALFGWAAWQPDGWRFASAIAFTLFVFAPALWIDRRS